MGNPLFVYEAMISLFPSDDSGQALLGFPIWLGACANTLRCVERLEGERIANSGDRYKRVVHVDESHEISIDRTWIVNAGQSAFRPQRNQQYVLQIVWTAQDVWHTRTYYGVTGSGLEQVSRGTLEFVQSQTFAAQSYDETTATPPSLGGGGADGLLAGFTPLNPAVIEQPVGFFHENPLAVGAYLLGQYRWSQTVQVTGARVIALAPQGAPVVLQLEVGGVLQPVTLTIPTGGDGVEVAADSASAFPVTVTAGQAVRWKCVSGPADSESMAWLVGVMMTLDLGQTSAPGAVPAATVQTVSFNRDAALVPGEYLLGNYRWAERMTGLRAVVSALASQGAATVLELEIAGALTGRQLSLPAGAANTSAAASVAWNDLVVLPDQTVRWKIVGGPADGERMAWMAVAQMYLQPEVADQSIGFSRETPFVPGEYLAGTYQWSVPMVGLRSAAIVLASQTTATVIELEINGALTGRQLSLAAGAANAQATAAADWSGLTIPANQPVRWKIVSGPADGESMAWKGSVNLSVRVA